MPLVVSDNYGFQRPFLHISYGEEGKPWDEMREFWSFRLCLMKRGILVRSPSFCVSQYVVGLFVSATSAKS